jgi:magnesium transporter
MDKIAPHETIYQIIESHIEDGRLDDLRALLATYHPADIADSLDALPPEHAVIVFGLLADETASEVLDETGSLIREELVEKIDDERLAHLLNVLPMDDAAEFLDQLSDETSDRLLGLMETEEAEEVREILSYRDETAGRLMNQDVATLRRYWTVAEALDYIRLLVEAEETETIHYLYVVDREERLIGVVPIRTLLLALPHQTIESLMKTDIFTVPVTADQEELAEAVSRYDFVAIPVVDGENHLLGVVTVDDVLDILEEEATEDIQRLGGSEPLAQPYFSASTLEIVRKRLVWLLPLFAASIVTDTVVNSFSDMLAAFVTVGIFIPVISGTAGNAGSQTVTTIIRAIAVNEVRLADFGRAWLREGSVAVILGLILGVAGYIRGLVLNAEPGVSLVLALTLPLVVVWANTVATLVPLLAERFRIDPTVVSAPMITTIVDASGIFIYLLLARIILNG